MSVWPQMNKGIGPFFLIMEWLVIVVAGFGVFSGITATVTFILLTSMFFS